MHEHQNLCIQLGLIKCGEVRRTGSREYGRTAVTVTTPGTYSWKAIESGTGIDKQNMAVAHLITQKFSLGVPHHRLEAEALEWGRRINGKSPTAQWMLKYSFNLIDDGLVGQQLLAGEATRLAYMTEEAGEGRDSFLEKRDPDWSRFPWHY